MVAKKKKKKKKKQSRAKKTAAHKQASQVDKEKGKPEKKDAPSTEEENSGLPAEKNEDDRPEEKEKTASSSPSRKEEDEEQVEDETSSTYQKRSMLGFLGVSARGIAMGTADVIPGVSGGTMALILGIYMELVSSIRSFDVDALKMLLKGRFRDFSSHVNLPFLLALGAGIGAAVVSLARIVPHLLQQYRAPVHGLFFGLILGSIYLLWKKIEEKNISSMIALPIGAVGAYFLVGMIPVNTPTNLPFVFFSGMIAIIAMILPGISGSFILLILGKYVFILGALSGLLHGKQFGSNVSVVVVFAAGCALGLTLFSRLLHWLLKRYGSITLALLTGLMIGSLRRIWPFQDVKTQLIRGKQVVVKFHNIIPTEVKGDYLIAASLLILGMAISIGLGYIGRQSES